MNRCKGNAVEVMVKHMREKPLDESEVRMIKSGMEKHGPTGFRGIHGDHPRLGREVGYLKRLWENHIESNEQDRLFMQRLVAKAEEEERARDAAKEEEKRRKREAKEKERLEAKLQRQREREEKRKVKEQQELHLKKVREEKKRAREEKKRQDLASKLARPKGSKQVAVEQGPPLGTSQDYHLAGALGARYWCGENDERAEPASFSGGWSKELDRIILLSVKTHGESDTAFHSAWNQMGGEVASPFSIEEVTQRWHWLCAKFMEGELTTAS
uniref:Uncharacterized protein n=1 Tax=Chloropicon primus TaxID=1764295 RepID=A0A7S2X079_9CHLO|mmetsp:Transcript_578/g.1673  ORF Transcript_578/g.1673 Transcript_578/m.1673 type:complete len:271 (+) Transcript_578:3-815(+)